MGGIDITLALLSSTHCRYFKQLALHLRGVGVSCPSLTFRTWPQPYFKRIMRDHTWHALSKGSSSTTRLNCFPGRLALGSFTDGKHVVHGCSTIDPDYTPAATPNQLWQRVKKLLGLLDPKNTSKVSL
ncbi:hypothetical protein TNCV_947761 [Trichonephila clavipes]|nr:hypothetical protein TNCV_947761 [Trichonephila clavipes]